MGRLRRTLLLGLPFALLAVLVPRKAHAKVSGTRTRPTGTSVPARSRATQTQAIVDRLRDSLSIPEPVAVVIAPQNRLLVSVARADDRRRGFELTIEESFLAGLSDAELEAVVAHELGHVWIFTHHPYLQTEELANGVALRLVDRKTLDEVYDKVWTRVGRRGSLSYFPSDDH